MPLDGEPSPLAYFPRVEQSQGLTCGFLLFSLQSMKYFWGFGCLLALAFCWCRGAVSEQAILAERTGFPMRFVLDKGRDLKETVSGNTFVATLPGFIRFLARPCSRPRSGRIDWERSEPPWPLTKGLRSGDPRQRRVNSETSSVGKEGFGFGRTFTWTVD